MVAPGSMVPLLPLPGFCEGRVCVPANPFRQNGPAVVGRSAKSEMNPRAMGSPWAVYRLILDYPIPDT